MSATLDHVPAETVEARVARMELSSLCRDGRHKACRDLQMHCKCDCHRSDARNNAQPQTRKSRPATAAKPQAARHNARTRGTRGLASHDGTEPQVQPVANRLPVVQLVKADPPPITKPPRVTLTGQIRPLLEEILVAGDRDWYRVVLFFKARQASMNLKRLRDAHSRTEWEWQARKLGEVDQSAIYVRWIGKERAVL